MALVKFRLVTSAVATGTALKTLAQLIAASNHAIRVNSIEVSFQGTSNTDAPIKVSVARQSTAGTMSALTPKKDPDDSDETLQATAQENASAEPTTGDEIDGRYVHPQTGAAATYRYDHPIKIGGGDRLGIRVTAGVSVNAIVTMHCEE